jgi:uncharacterized integral membrane protein
VITVGGLLASLGIFVLVLALTRRVSAGSLAASVSLPLFVGWWTRHPGPAVVALAVAVLIVVRHRENIQRLRRGTEPPLWGAIDGQSPGFRPSDHAARKGYVLRVSSRSSPASPQPRPRYSSTPP